MVAGRRVLVAEESGLMRAWLRSALSRIAEVDEAGTAWGLLSRLGEGGDEYDLVVCQRDLGTMTGEQVLATARTAGLDVPFLIIAPFSSDRSRAVLARAGRAVILDDPLDTRRLLDLAESLMGVPHAAQLAMPGARTAPTLSAD